jgi:hypothetical protein
MAATVSGTANAAAGTSVTIPTHAVGQLIGLFVYRDGATATPTQPAAAGTVPNWVTPTNGNPTGANTNSARVAYFVATATNHTSGTWTNATGMVAVVIDGADPYAPFGGLAISGSTGTNTASAPAVTQTDTSGAALLLEFYGHRTVTAWGTAPAGYTRRASAATEVCLNTKDSSTTDGAIAQPCTAANSGYRCATVEILAAPAAGAKTETLTDTYSSADAVKWTFGPGAAVASGTVNLTSWADWRGYAITNAAFDLTGSFILAELTSAPTNTAVLSTLAIKFSNDGTNRVEWAHYHNGTNWVIRATEVIADVQTSSTEIIYSATNHRWLRFRHDGGTPGNLIWETSPTAAAGSWTTQYTKACALISITSGWMFQDSGGVDDSAAIIKWDNFNTAPVSGLTGAGTLTSTATIAGAGTTSGPGTVTAAAAITGSGVVARTGAGTSITTATIAGVGAAVIAGAGTQTATATIAGAGATTGTGAVTVTATRSGAGAVAVTGSGSLTVAAAASGAAGAAGFTGTGTSTTTATIAGAGTTTGAGTRPVTATLTGSGLTAAVGAGTSTTAATITGAGVVGVTGAGSRTATATVTGAGTAAGTGTLTTTAAATGTGVLATTGTGSLTVAATINGSAGTLILGTGTRSTTATIAGAGTAAVTGTGTRTATATIAGAGTAAATGTGTSTTTATITGSGVVAVTGSGTRPVTATIAGSSGVGYVGTGTRTVTATITGAGALGSPAHGGTITAITVITGSGIVARKGNGTILVVASITGSAGGPPLPQLGRIASVWAETRTAAAPLESRTTTAALRNIEADADTNKRVVAVNCENREALIMSGET